MFYFLEKKERKKLPYISTLFDHPTNKLQPWKNTCIHGLWLQTCVWTWFSLSTIRKHVFLFIKRLSITGPVNFYKEDKINVKDIQSMSCFTSKHCQRKPMLTCFLTTNVKTTYKVKQEKYNRILILLFATCSKTRIQVENLF